jgi:deazaflavin-dependent oxidoreductase (nitroreductase family)
MAGIPAFDPNAPRGRFYRVVQAFIRTSAGRSLAINFAARTDPLLLKWSRGRLGVGMVMPTAGLTTTGAKSGAKRTAAVLYFTDADQNRPDGGPDVILIASNFGREKHPSWYYNLKAHPDAQLERGGIKATYSATLVADEAEYRRLFALANKVYSGYDDYKIRTAAVGRSIPIFRLTPSGS